MTNARLRRLYADYRDVTEQFGKPRGLARTTILTVMERLRKKNFVKRQERKEQARQAARQERHGKHRDKGRGRRGRRR